MKCLGNELSKCNVNVHMFYINAENDVQDLSYIIDLNNLRFDKAVSGYQIFQNKEVK